MAREGLVLVLPAVLLGGCATVEHSALPLPATALQARQAQTRTLEGVGSEVVLKAALNALQDEGFVIRQVNSELGLVSAVKEWRSRKQPGLSRTVKWLAALPTYGASLLVPTEKTEFTSVEANVNVMAEAEQTRVRISLVSKVTDGQGRICSVTPVEDPLVYQGLLARLDQAVYLQNEGF
ncbi:MAG TPA: hypothetical protein VMX54_00580 [Vicinamibacteria bacterium]|nr:hypothetical protein [Vicinamibacteria bacterium]